MEEQKNGKRTYDKRLFFSGIIIFTVSFGFFVCSFFFAENLAAYFGITFILFAIGWMVLSLSGFFRDVISGFIISFAIFLSGLFLFCFSFLKGNSSDNSEIYVCADSVIYSKSNTTLIEPVSSAEVTNVQDINSSNFSDNSGLYAANSSDKEKSALTSSYQAVKSNNSSSIVSSENTVGIGSNSTKSVNESVSAPSVTCNLDIDILTELKFKRNQVATVRIKGKANTEYGIAVYYSSGKSTASGLENKVSDENGEVSWSFKIGGRTTPGKYKLIISSGNNSSEYIFTVE